MKNEEIISEARAFTKGRYLNPELPLIALIRGLVSALEDESKKSQTLREKINELADEASGGWVAGYVQGAADTLPERVQDPAKMPINLSGWGATFHRHAMSNEIHRDGGPECAYSSRPSTVYPFDPDALAEHEALLKSDAWDEGHEAGAEEAWAQAGDRAPANETNPYRSGGKK